MGIEEKKAFIGQFKRQSVGGQGDGPKPKKAKQEGHEHYMLLFGWLSFNNCESLPSHSIMFGCFRPYRGLFKEGREGHRQGGGQCQDESLEGQRQRN